MKKAKTFKKFKEPCDYRLKVTDRCTHVPICNPNHDCLARLCEFWPRMKIKAKVKSTKTKV